MSQDSLDTRVTQLLTQGGTRLLQVQPARLRVVEGPDKGLEIDLGEGLLIGSGEHCKLRLADKAVSRRHCELRLAGGELVLRDLGSSNGSYLDGVRVERAYVDGPCELQLGTTRIDLSLDAEPQHHALSDRVHFGLLFGQSLAMQRVYALLERAAGSDATLLLQGETGTGKDLAAESLHAASARRDGPFVVVDCGAVAPGLIESELFGHVRGAFSGATSDRAGAFELADGGTVFLDEIGDLPLELQPKLLRVLERGEFKRLGEGRQRRSDVRIVAATHRDLGQAVADRSFRQDLFYRLSVLRISMPPLRDRPEDVEVLARIFLQRAGAMAEPDAILNANVLRMLGRHDWPGNVRELRNVIERLHIFQDDPAAALAEPLRKADDPTDLLTVPFHEARRLHCEAFERSYLDAALKACDGVVSRAAKKVALPRQSFYRLLAKFPELRPGQD